MKYILQNIRPTLLLTAIAVFASCSDSLNTDNSSIVFPDKNISFTKTVQPFLRTTCSFQGCHSSTNPAGGRAMVEYADLFDVTNAGLIVPGNPSASMLIKILEDSVSHTVPVYIKVNDNQKKGMRQWIKEGAN